MNIYDSFSSPTINYAKWADIEFVREIRSNHLFSKISAYGIDNYNYMHIKNPGSIYHLEADVMLSSASAPYDPADTNVSTLVRAGLNGTFYNDGTMGSNYLGDVTAQVRLVRERGEFQAQYRVFRYNVDDGSTYDVLQSGRIDIPILMNQTYRLSIKFEPTAKRFTFGVNAVTRQWTATGTVNPPRVNWKALMTWVVAPSGYWGSVSATFDNVTGRNTADVEVFSETFSTATIDDSKWSTLEFVREIENGHLRLKYKRIDLAANVGNSLRFNNSQMINEIQAKVSLTQFDKGTGTGLVARIGGFFLNLTGSTNNYLNEIYAGVSLGGYADTVSPPQAEWRVSHITAADMSTYDILDSGVLMPISLDETYTLYLKWDGNQFTFRCVDSLGNQASSTYAPAAVFPSNKIAKDIQVRIMPTTAPPNVTTGSATFDEVWTNIDYLYLPLTLKN